jgi:hypothetical protein
MPPGRFLFSGATMADKCGAVEFVRALADALGLDDKITSIEIRASIGSMPVITVSYAGTTDHLDSLQKTKGSLYAMGRPK